MWPNLSKYRMCSNEMRNFVCSAAFVVCFVENGDHITGSLTRKLLKAAWDWFRVSSDKVFVWQYNGQSPQSERFIYILSDISKALVCVMLHVLF